MIIMFFIFLCCSDLKDEEQDQIAELYQKMMPQLLNLCKTRLKSPCYAEDIVQTAFIILIKKYNDLTPENLSLWLIKVTNNLIKNQNRKEKSQNSIIPIISINTLKDDDAIYRENSSFVMDILKRELSEAELDFFNTYFVLFDSHETASKKYGISINASKARKNRIKTKVIRILEQNGIVK